MAGRGQGEELEAPHLDNLVVAEDKVVGREHGCIRCASPQPRTGLAHLRYGLNVVPMTVGLDHLRHPEALAKVKQFVVLVGGIDKHCIASFLQRNTNTLLSADHHQRWISAWWSS